MPKTWIVTGGNRGLGHSIVKVALAAGHNVLATARDTSKLASLSSGYGDQLAVFTLDVTDEVRTVQAAEEAIRRFGGIDILVNNAGYGHFEAFEQKAPDRFRAEIETNLFGVVNMTRAVLPHMRHRRAGHIFNISSVGGRLGTPGLSAYQAAKWAVGGFTEVLRAEVDYLGIKIVSLEPGGMRTAWAEAAGSPAAALILADYELTVGEAISRIRSYAGREVGDPAYIARLILALSERADLPAHLVLGTDAISAFDAAEKMRQLDYDRWLPVSRSTVFGVPENQDLRSILPIARHSCCS